MQSKAATADEYFSQLPEDRKEAMKKLRKEIKKNLPKGFAEEMSYGMVGYVVPHSIYPAGYHCNPKLPLSFMNVGSQKNNIVIHHLGIYADPKLLEWFTAEYPKHTEEKLDMGKGCIRFKKPDAIPFKLIGELAGKITVKDWINKYESAFKKTAK